MKKLQWNDAKKIDKKDLKDNQCIEIQKGTDTEAFIITSPPQELIRTIRMICQQVDACRNVGRYQNPNKAIISKVAFITEIPWSDIK